MQIARACLERDEIKNDASQIKKRGNCQQVEDFVALEYEFLKSDLEKDMLDYVHRHRLYFYHRHKSLYLPNAIEWDVSVVDKPDSVIILRTPVSRLVYLNTFQQRIILQIVRTNSLYDRFCRFVSLMEKEYNVDPYYSLVKKSETFNNSSIIIDYDPDGFTCFDRVGTALMMSQVHTLVSDRAHVVGLLYLDKKFVNLQNQKNGLRWRLFQLRQIFLGPQKCMIRLQSDLARESSDESFDRNFFAPFVKYVSVNIFPPPPPPPPPPPVFSVNPIIKKNAIISKIRKQNDQKFVLSQSELDAALKRLRKES